MPMPRLLSQGESPQAHHELPAPLAHLKLDVLLEADARRPFAHHFTVQLDDLDAARGSRPQFHGFGLLSAPDRGSEQ